MTTWIFGRGLRDGGIEGAPEVKLDVLFERESIELRAAGVEGVVEDVGE